MLVPLSRENEDSAAPYSSVIYDCCPVAVAHKQAQPLMRKNTLFHQGPVYRSLPTPPFIYTDCVNNTSINEMPQLSNGCSFSQNRGSITLNARLSHKNKSRSCLCIRLYSGHAMCVGGGWTYLTFVCLDLNAFELLFIYLFIFSFELGLVIPHRRHM